MLLWIPDSQATFQIQRATDWWNLVIMPKHSLNSLTLITKQRPVAGKGLGQREETEGNITYKGSPLQSPLKTDLRKKKVTSKFIYAF